MSKKSTALATLDPEVAAARAALREDVSQDDLTIPTLVIFEDQGKQEEKFGQHPKGSVINSLTNLAIGETRIVPVYFKKNHVAWFDRKSPKSTGAPIVSWDRGTERPDFDMMGEPIDWNDPDILVNDQVDVFFVFDAEPMPVIFRAAKSRIRGTKSMNTLEAQRQAQGRPPGAYTFETVRTEKDGDVWHSPKFTPVGDADADEMASYKVAANWILANRENYRTAEDEPAKPAGGSEGIRVGDPPI